MHVVQSTKPQGSIAMNYLATNACIQHKIVSRYYHFRLSMRAKLIDESGRSLKQHNHINNQYSTADSFHATNENKFEFNNGICMANATHQCASEKQNKSAATAAKFVQNGE